MYRQTTILIVCAILLFLSGCVPGMEKEDHQKKQIVNDEEKGKQEKKVEITPKAQTSDEYYRTIAGFKEGPARGNITYGVDNRLDIDELETGLMRHSQADFSPDDYIFQEGQYLSSDNIEDWLQNKSKKEKKHSNPEGLNPKLPKNYQGRSWRKKKKFLKNHPSYLNYVVEQNYLKEDKKDQLKLGGVSIALSMNKVFSYQIEDSKGLQHKVDVKLNHDDIVKAAQKDAGIILKRLRKNDDLKDVPVVIALYQEQQSDSIVPGHYFSKTMVKAGKTKIGKWHSLKESYAFFPSDGNKGDHKADADSFDKFKSDIEKYFPNFVGVVGKGFYKKDDLQKLSVNIPIKFYSKTEVISFAQYISGLVDEKRFPFPKEVPVEVNISSSKGQEALVVRNPDMDKPFVHIYEH